MKKEKVTVYLMRMSSRLNFIFDNNSIFDYDDLEKIATKFINDNCSIHTELTVALNQAESTNVKCFVGQKELHLHINGYDSRYLAAIIKVCAINGVPLVLHYPGVSLSQRMF